MYPEWGSLTGHLTAELACSALTGSLLLSPPQPCGLKFEGPAVCEGWRGCCDVKTKKIKERQEGDADSVTGACTINTSKITVCAEQLLAYPDPRETRAALTISRNSNSLHIFSSSTCFCRIFHFMLLNIKPCKHLRVFVPYCQSNYPSVAVSNLNGITYVPGQFQNPVAR